jgi:hypothetical protein
MDSVDLTGYLDVQKKNIRSTAGIEQPGRATSCVQNGKRARPNRRPDPLRAFRLEAEGTGLEPATPVKGHLISSRRYAVSRPSVALPLLVFPGVFKVHFNQATPVDARFW